MESHIQLVNLMLKTIMALGDPELVFHIFIPLHLTKQTKNQILS